MPDLTLNQVMDALAVVQEPALEQPLAAAGLLRDVAVKGGKVSLTLALLSPAHPHQAEMEDAIRAALGGLPGFKSVEITPLLAVPADPRLQAVGKSDIKTVIAVASGKGGVGKSTVAVNIAVALAQAGAAVGLMDADVYGPNVPMMMGVDRLPPVTDQTNIPPAEAHGVKMMSIGFMVKKEQPIVWRGPMLHTAIRQFTQDVNWGHLDYLVVDLPPGTGDAQLSLAQTVSVTGGVIVTLPQAVSLEDARRGLEMFRQLSIPILGVVENMSYLELPDGSRMDIFGSGGGEKMAAEAGVDFMGGIPLDPNVRVGGDNGVPIILSQPDSPVAQALRGIAAEAALRASMLALKNQSSQIPISIVG
ncbi:MAG: iron-sulfur cluster carrier protein ApbC [Anaerolineae bacterium]|nr:MAG: iron-sulfur cluster carrier protein ApbC [Anaerolineae bacterium]